MPDSSPERELEDLLSELFDPEALRRFVHRGFGDRVSRLLPTPPVSAQQLCHECSRLLVSRGLVDLDFFVDLVAESPEKRPRIEALASRFGVGPVPAHALQRAQAQRPSVPERVIEDLYEDLRRQQALVRDFLGGPWSRLNEARLRGDQVERREFDGLAEACEAWTRAHLDQLTVPEVVAAFQALRFTHRLNPLESGTAALLSFVALANEGSPVLKSIDALNRFAKMDAKDLWHRASERAKGS